jgi:hypothetical protein
LWAIRYVVFYPELNAVKRAESHMPIKAFLDAHAETHSAGALVLGVLRCILFVAGGVWMFNTGEDPIIVLLSAGFFGVFGLGWGYALYLKIQK